MIIERNKLIVIIMAALAIGYIAAPNPTTKIVEKPAKETEQYQRIVAKDDQIFLKVGSAFMSVSEILSAVSQGDMATLESQTKTLQDLQLSVTGDLNERKAMVSQLSQ